MVLIGILRSATAMTHGSKNGEEDHPNHRVVSAGLPWGRGPRSASASVRSHDLWYVLRVMSEFVEAIDTFDALDRPAVALFGSARLREGHPYYEATRLLGRRLGEAGFTVVTGGGPGLMEAANRGAADVEAPSVALNIKLPREQKANPYATLPIEFDFFPVRKAMFSFSCSAIVAMPGGYGTLDELFTIATLRQTGKIAPVPIYLVGREYWAGMLDWMREAMLGEEMILEQDLDELLVFDDVDLLVGDLERRAKTVRPTDLRRF
jgi:uncharacterized protein (TIGR00730 family)